MSIINKLGGGDPTIYGKHSEQMNRAILQLKRIDKQDNLERLTRDVPTTTELYRELVDPNSTAQRPIYMSHNTERNRISQIFSLRSGNPQLADMQHKRHLTSSPQCHCGEDETIQHFLEDCKSYAEERAKFKHFLQRQVLDHLPLTEVCLAGKAYMNKVRELSQVRISKIDNRIKDYIEKLHKLRLEKLQSAQ